MADKQMKFVPSTGRVTVELSEDTRLMSSGYSLIAKVLEIGPLVDDRPLGFAPGDMVKLQALQGHPWEYDGKVCMTVDAVIIESKVIYED